jgi:hypothetical protein
MHSGIHQFMLGALVMACAVAGLFFLRFWREASDRLFLLFGVAFLVLGAQWAGLAVTTDEPGRVVLYVARLVAFGLILAGVIWKNSSTKGSSGRTDG